MAVKKVTSNKEKVTRKTVEKAVKVVASKKTASKLSVTAYSLNGEKGADVTLSAAIFGQKDNKQLLAQAVQVYLGNQRSAQAKTKTRAEVDRTTAKIYKQKGTGGARHGSRKAPIYVGGGIAHGPTGTQNYARTLSKRLRSRALAVALSTKVRAGQIMIADIEKIEAKTKNIANILKKMNLTGKTLLVCTENSLYVAGRNISNLTIVQANELTTYHVLSSKNIILTNDALNVIIGRYKESPLSTSVKGSQDMATPKNA